MIGNEMKNITLDMEQEMAQAEARAGGFFGGDSYIAHKLYVVGEEAAAEVQKLAKAEAVRTLSGPAQLAALTAAGQQYHATIDALYREYQKSW